MLGTLSDRAYAADARPDPLARFVVTGVVASLLLHLGVVLFLHFGPPPPAPPDEPDVVEVTLGPPPEPAARERRPERIVSPPAVNTPAVPPPDTRNRSDVDSRAEREQIKRGAEDSGPVKGESAPRPPAPPSRVTRPSAEKPRAPRPSVPRPAEPAGASSPPARLKTLSLDAATLARKFAAPDRPPSRDRPAATRPFSRPPGSGARFVGALGTSDYLPNLPDGDITLLNAKADRYAVFVRRVASQVFAAMRASGWETLTASDIASLRDFATVEAVLTPEGTLKQVTIQGTSGVARFDESLAAAARRGARDPNPPPGVAAADGAIHFVFKSRSWVQGGVSGRTGAPLERRWLLLGTGLE